MKVLYFGDKFKLLLRIISGCIWVNYCFQENLSQFFMWFWPLFKFTHRANILFRVIGHLELMRRLLLAPPAHFIFYTWRGGWPKSSLRGSVPNSVLFTTRLLKFFIKKWLLRCLKICWVIFPSIFILSKYGVCWVQKCSHPLAKNSTAWK